MPFSSRSGSPLLHTYQCGLHCPGLFGGLWGCYQDHTRPGTAMCFHRNQPSIHSRTLRPLIEIILTKVPLALYLYIRINLSCLVCKLQKQLHFFELTSLETSSYIKDPTLLEVLTQQNITVNSQSVIPGSNTTTKTHLIPDGWSLWPDFNYNTLT